MTAKLVKIGILVTGIALAAPAFASAGATLPPEHKAGSVTYRSGGIGDNEANAMKAAEHRYSLALEFVRKAKPKDEYLADISVKVKDKTGKMLLNAKSGGPFLLAQVPAGDYTIVADNDGHMLTRTAEISPQHHARVVFVWPEQAKKP